MARKKMAAGTTRPVCFRLQEADYSAFVAKATTAGLSPSEFFRDAVLTNRTQIFARAKTSKDKGRLLYLFNKTSNNINQLAYRANADHLAGTIDEATYAQILVELHALTNLLKAGLSDVD